MRTLFCHDTKRSGFTIVELIIVLTIAGLTMAMAAPRVENVRVQTSVRTAQTQVASYVSAARAAAIQRGTPAHLHVEGGRIWVTVEENGTLAVLKQPTAMQSELGVELSSSVPEITFNSRGFAPALAASATLVVARQGVSDSLCVTRAGSVSRRGCTA